MFQVHLHILDTNLHCTNSSQNEKRHGGDLSDISYSLSNDQFRLCNTQGQRHLFDETGGLELEVALLVKGVMAFRLKLMS